MAAVTAVVSSSPGIFSPGMNELLDICEQDYQTCRRNSLTRLTNPIALKQEVRYTPLFMPAYQHARTVI